MWLLLRDFFGIANEGVNSCNLIDRINLFFKGQDGVEFSDEEKVFVDRADKLETEDEVLDLAEELYKYMEDNPENRQWHDNGESAPSDTGDSGEKSSEESGDTSDDLRSTDDSTVDNSGSNVGDDDGDDDGDADGGSAGDSDDAGDDTESTVPIPVKVRK